MIDNLTDKRKKYDIPLSKVLSLVFYSLLTGKNTLLAMDHIAREDFTKCFFNSDRNMVASDSTIKRCIGKHIVTDELVSMNYDISKSRYVRPALVNPILNRTCGIMDGSGMSKFFKEVFLIPGVIDFIFQFNTIPKRGKELVSAADLIDNISSNVGENFFDLLLFDGLYYSKKIFEQVDKKLKAKCLVKTRENLNIVKDVDFYFKCKCDNIIQKKGFDSDRMCNYDIKIAYDVKADTIDYPLQVAIVNEKYSKTGKKETFYIITNDLELTPEQLRQAAHIRWRIENNGFKLLNKLFQTKRKISDDEVFINNFLWVIFITYNCLMLFLQHIDIDSLELKVKVTHQYILDKFYQSLILMFSIKKYSPG